MGWKRTESFVLRSIPLGETDRIVTLFSREGGKVRAVAKHARRSRKRFGGSLELLTRVQARYFEREGVELARLESCEILESSFDLLQSSLEAAYLLSYFAELAEAFSREREPEPTFFRLLNSCLAAARAGSEIPCLARYFEFWTLRLHGLLPDLQNCSRCARELRECHSLYPTQEKEMLCGRCAGAGNGDRIQLGKAEVMWIRRLHRVGPLEMCKNPGSVSRSAGLARYARREIEGYLERRLRSYRFLAGEGSYE